MFRILFTIGSFSIYSYGLMIAIAFIAGIFFAIREAKRSQENPEVIFDLSLYVILGAMLGGRLGYVLTHIDYYTANPIQILYFRQGGLSFLGGFFAAYFLCWLYVKRTKIPFWKYADIFAPSIALGIGIGRLGCFLNGCCYGVVSENFGIRFPSFHMPPVYLQQFTDGLISSGSTHSLPVIPTQLYSSLYGFLIFFILLWIKKYKKYDGFLMLSFFILFSISRFIVEFFRFNENSSKAFNFISVTKVILKGLILILKFINLLTITQVILIDVVLISLIYMYILKKKKKKSLSDEEGRKAEGEKKTESPDI